MYDYGTRPALSSVTSPVAKLPLLTKVLSLFINTGLIKLLENPVSKFTTSYNWAVRQKLRVIILFSGRLRAHQEPHLRPHGHHRELERQGGGGRGGVHHPDQAADLARREQRSEVTRTNCRGEQRAALDKPWENRNIQSWELLDQLALTLVKWLKTPTRSL